MKKAWIIILLGLVFVLSSCTQDDAVICDKDQELNMWNRCVDSDFSFDYSHDLDVIIDLDSDASDHVIEIYSSSHDPGVSYVGISSLIDSLSSVMKPMNISHKESKLIIQYDVGENDASDGYDYKMVFDAERNTVSFNMFDIFQYMNKPFWSPNLSYTVYRKSYQIQANEVIQDVNINLDNYDIDVIKHEEDVYIPLYLADLFVAGNNINLYEMKNHMIVFSSHSNIQPYLDQYQAKEQGELLNVARNTENFLILYMDYFYGLKEFFDVSSYRQQIESLTLTESDSFEEYYTKLNRFFISLDDVHTRFINAGYNNPSYEPITEYPEGSRLAKFYQRKADLECEEKTEPFTFEVIEDTAYIELYRFYSNVDDLVTAFLNVRSRVNHVEIDLSCNLGGNSTYMFVVLTLITTKPLPFRTYNPSTGLYKTHYYSSAQTRTADADYTVIVSNVTYSAGNLFASVVKDLDIATLEGETTAGGAATINYVILPDGSLVSSSQNTVLVNEAGDIIEMGITP